MTPDEVRRWTAALAAYLPEERPLTILDLGSGTGRLTPGLADEFRGPVYGVEPSDRMREIGEAGRGAPGSDLPEGQRRGHSVA